MQLDPRDLDDGGMYAWGVILAILSLAASYSVAAWWQRRKERQKSA